MKNLVFISVCSMVLLCGNAEAQTGLVFSATGGCSSVTTANTPSYETYTNGIFATSNEVDISGFEKGMYAVTIERDGKRIFTDKLVVNQ